MAILTKTLVRIFLRKRTYLDYKIYATYRFRRGRREERFGGKKKKKKNYERGEAEGNKIERKNEEKN